MIKSTKTKSIQQLIIKYITVKKKLQKALKFSGGDIEENYGIFLTSQYIPKLMVNKHSNIKGYDAIDEFNKKIEFKTVTTKKENKYGSVFKSWKNKKEFDYVVLISLDKNFKPNFILRISTRTFKKYYSKKSDSLSISQKLVKNSSIEDINFFEISKGIDLHDIWNKKFGVD